MDSLNNLDLKAKGSTTPLAASSVPGFIPNSKNGIDFKKHRVRYLKLNMDELGDISELERIETKATRNEGMYVLSKKEFIFMDKIFILIQYLEEVTE